MSSISKLNGFYATFKCFPVGTWSVSVVQLGTAYSTGASETILAPNSSYTGKFNTPTLVQAGVQAYVRACQSGTCYTSSAVTVGL